MDGGHKSVAVCFCGYKSLKAHHNPQTMRKCHSYMDPKSSALATSVERMGKLANKKLNVFTIETTINNRMFDRPSSSSTRTRTTSPEWEKTALKALTITLSKLPQAARQAILSRRCRSTLRRHRAWSPARPRPYTSTRFARCYEQYLVPIKGQADILVTGVPYNRAVQRQLVPEPAARAGHGERLPVQHVQGARPLLKKAAR